MVIKQGILRVWSRRSWSNTLSVYCRQQAGHSSNLYSSVKEGTIYRWRCPHIGSSVTRETSSWGRGHHASSQLSLFFFIAGVFCSILETSVRWIQTDETNAASWTGEESGGGFASLAAPDLQCSEKWSPRIRMMEIEVLGEPAGLSCLPSKVFRLVVVVVGWGIFNYFTSPLKNRNGAVLWLSLKMRIPCCKTAKLNHVTSLRTIPGQ